MKIIVLKDNKPIDQITIEGDSARIGRRSDCDISIKDPAVSGNHASLQCVGGKVIITDEGSTNGIYIGGKRVKQQVLRHEDVVTIGEHMLKFLIADSPAGRSKAPLPGAAKDVKPSSGPGKAVLNVVQGSKKGTVIALDEGLTTIGEPGVQVAAVSRRPQGHFIIHVDGGKDKDRVPLVNGEPIGFKSRKLEQGDRIEVAGIVLEYDAS
ncbi:MAG: FHA domain-containing protein [Pseudomonadales bacterium]|nr:FHA domain-containing protein [Pseudomonadales bacterium]